MIAAQLERRHMTQGELARRSGLSQQYVSEIISGRRRLSVRAARVIGAALGVSPRKLLIAQLDKDLSA